MLFGGWQNLNSPEPRFYTQIDVHMMNYHRFFLAFWCISVALGNGLAPLNNMTQAVARTNSDITVP